MKVNELVNLLKKLPEDTEVTLYNNQYAGGLFDDLESEPILSLDRNLNLVICDDYTQNDAKCFYGELYTIDELLELAHKMK